MADHLTLRVFVPELYQLFAAKAEEHILRALLAAVALILHLAGIEDLRVEARHCQLHHILRGLPCPEQLGDGRHGGDVLLQTGDLGIGRARQELQQIAAGAGDGQILVHQNAQRTHGGDLLAVGIVAGDVLGDLTGHQRHLTHRRLLLELVVPDDGQNAVFADCAAHVQMSVLLCGKLDQRVVDAAFDVAVCIGAGDDDARRAAAGHAQSDGITIILEHRAHQGDTGEQPAKGCAAGGAGGMQLFCRADDLSGVHAAEHDTAVFRNAADKIRHIIVPPVGYTV